MHEVNFEPNEGRVLVLPTLTDMSEGGIIIPKGSNKKVQHGIIVAVGAPSVVLSGDVAIITEVVDDYPIGTPVYYNESFGTGIKLNNIDYVIMRRQDILGREKQTK